MPIFKTDPNLKDVPYHLITTRRELETALRSLEDSPILGLDCETTGLDPHIDTIRLIQIATPNQPVILIDALNIAVCDRNPLRQFLSRPVLKITHNGKFDWQFLTRAGLQPSAPFFDTQLAYRVLTAGLKTGLSLQTLAQKLLNIELDKTQQVSDWSKPLTSHQLQYAAVDAAVLLELYPILVKKLERSQLLKIAQLEFYCMPAVAQMELNGMLLDLSRWQTLGAKLESDRDAALRQVRQLRIGGNAQMSLLPELTDTINPNSPQQVLAALQAVGIPVTSTNQKELVPLAKHYPVIQALLDYRHLAKITATFADTLPQHIHPLTGRIHTTYYQLGARS
ncbi:MAG TPA: DNA polymerase, partial [Allocoleopsis sp.]